MDDLIERLERAQASSRELDIEICVALGKSRLDPGFQTAPPYTLSIDAAVTLVPEDWYWEVALGVEGSAGSICGPGPYWSETYPKDFDFGRLLTERGVLDYDGVFLSGARNPAMAICLGALKARRAVKRNSR